MIAEKIALGALVLFLCSCSGLPREKVAVAPPAPIGTPRFQVFSEVYQEMLPGEGSVAISLDRQELTLRNKEGEAVILADCSTGLEGRETPSGSFRIREMIVDKRSNKYGQYVSKETGEVVVAKSWEVAAAPAGTEYLGIAMPYWMRLTWSGVGIHVGKFHRGQRSSFGCIRMPAEVQPLIYQKCALGMPVIIQ